MTSLMDQRPHLMIPPAHHGHPADRWSLRDVITLPAQPASVPQARARARQCLRDWGFGRQLTLDACLVLTELATNAVQASEGLPAGAFVHVALGAGNGGASWLLVAVADPSPKFPLLLTGEPDAIGGRGLRIVGELSTRWGWHPASGPESGPWLLKVVWAEFSKDTHS